MSAGKTIALLGPTGVGKTAVGVELSRLLGARIISCDSMQVYEGFSVLTNQPRHAEDRPDLHELVGFLDPGCTMSAGEYAELAAPVVESSVEECGAALLVGGSGLYMRAAVAPLAARTPGDPALRSALEVRAKAEGLESLHKELRLLDPEAAASIDARNGRRILRALEGVLTHGTNWSGRTDLWEPDYYRSTLTVGLYMGRENLAARIVERTKRMLQEGVVEEVDLFRRERGEGFTAPGLPGICSAIGYRELVDYLRGVLDYQGVAELMAAATRRYARRQGTWLRKVRDAVMIDIDGREPAQIAEQIAGLADSMID